MIISNIKVLRLGIENLNGRIYTLENTEGAVREFRNRLRREVILGQIGFPDDFNMSCSNASHQIISLRIQGEYVLAGIETLETGEGELLESLIGDGIAFRTRSIGTVDDKGVVQLQQILSVDAIEPQDDSYNGLMEDENDSVSNE